MKQTVWKTSSDSKGCYLLQHSILQSKVGLNSCTLLPVSRMPLLPKEVVDLKGLWYSASLLYKVYCGSRSAALLLDSLARLASLSFPIHCYFARTLPSNASAAGVSMVIAVKSSAAFRFLQPTNFGCVLCETGVCRYALCEQVVSHSDLAFRVKRKRK